MLRGLVVLIATLWAGSAAAACPGLHNKDKHLFFTARQLQTPKVAEVPGSGNIPFDPSVSVHYVVDRPRMDLEFRTEGACDATLLLRTPAGRWFFDDDNGPGRNARLRLGSPSEGRYEIWVGSQGGDACAARLALQTFRGVVRLAQAPRRAERM